MSTSLSGTSQATLEELRALLHEASRLPELSMIDQRVRCIHDRILACLDASSIEDAEQILSYPDICELRASLIALNAEMHQKTEIALAHRYLSSCHQEDPFEGSWVNKGFSSLLNTQIENWKNKGYLPRISAGHIIVVGGGAIPQTQVFLNRRLGCSVVSVDSHAESAELCKAVLQKTGLAHLEVVNEEGAHFDYSGASLIVVATLVRNKASIAEQVAETAPSALFAPRSPLGLHAMWREVTPSSEFEKWGWRELDQCVPTNSSVGSSTFARY